MQIKDMLMMEIAKKLLHNNKQYLEFGLAIEEAVESLRKEKTAQVFSRLDEATREIANQYGGRGWFRADTVKWSRAQFIRRFYRASEKGDRRAGVWIGIWKTEREPLMLQICAEGWPQDNDAVTAPAVSAVFDEFVEKNERDELWSEDGPDRGEERKVSWHLNGDRAFLVRKLDAGQMLKGLLTGLMDAFDKTGD